ncbi:MAG: 30S ribosomal protein S24e [Candidatus Diapherotrites archaeon]
MKLNIYSREKNPLLEREEISFGVESASVTPSRKDVRAKIAALVNAKEETVVIEQLRQRFGEKKTEGTARVYASVEKMNKIEPKHLVERNFGGGKKGKKEGEAEEAPKEDKKAEK